LRQANTQLFGPRGLYAIVTAFNAQQSQIYMADHSCSYANPSSFSSESRINFAPPLVFSKNEPSTASLKTARGHKVDAKKSQRQQNSRRRIGQRPEGLLNTAFEGAFSSRVTGPGSVYNASNGMMREIQEHVPLGQPFEPGEINPVCIPCMTNTAVLTTS